MPSLLTSEKARKTTGLVWPLQVRGVWRSELMMFRWVVKQVKGIRSGFSQEKSKNFDQNKAKSLHQAGKQR